MSVRYAKTKSSCLQTIDLVVFQGFSFSWVSRSALQSAVEKDCVGVLSLVSFQLSCAFCRLLCFLPGFQCLHVSQIDNRPGRLPVHTVPWSFSFYSVAPFTRSADISEAGREALSEHRESGLVSVYQLLAFDPDAAASNVHGSMFERVQQFHISTAISCWIAR
ncbi:hypothetical protein KC19_9G119700 [Ceratodon purpureus]|uniref:Uncharacterized protein n=1 Tax=Ceratodon purpureus TaxID=3225 RepID=A0A8T0GU80_CERPU|nr:hypothetical protein KC19_9G119700 [Ceratodon purpureus]